jgi:hypothetical protein
MDGRSDSDIPAFSDTPQYYSFISVPDSSDSALNCELSPSNMSFACAVPSSAGNAQVSVLNYEYCAIEARS